MAEEVNIAIPHYDSKRGRDLFDKASVWLLAANHYNLKQQGANAFLKPLQWTSDAYY